MPKGSQADNPNKNGSQPDVERYTIYKTADQNGSQAQSQNTALNKCIGPTTTIEEVHFGHLLNKIGKQTSMLSKKTTGEVGEAPLHFSLLAIEIQLLLMPLRIISNHSARLCSYTTNWLLNCNISSDKKGPHLCKMTLINNCHYHNMQ